MNYDVTRDYKAQMLQQTPPRWICYDHAMKVLVNSKHLKKLVKCKQKYPNHIVQCGAIIFISEELFVMLRQYHYGIQCLTQLQKKQGGIV